MNQWLKPPRAVGEAKEAQKGMHLILEILVFIAVFFVCTIGEVLVVMPVQIIVLMRSQDYLDAVASGDLNRVAEVSAQIANADTLTIANLFATVMMIIIIFLFCRFIQKRKLSTLGFTGENALIHYGRGLVIGFVIFSLAVCFYRRIKIRNGTICTSGIFIICSRIWHTGNGGRSIMPRIFYGIYRQTISDGCCSTCQFDGICSTASF